MGKLTSVKDKDYANNMDLFRSDMRNKFWLSATVAHWCHCVADKEHISEQEWDTALQILSMEKPQQANCVIINNKVVQTNTRRQLWQKTAYAGWTGYDPTGKKLNLPKKEDIV